MPILLNPTLRYLAKNCLVSDLFNLLHQSLLFLYLGIREISGYRKFPDLYDYNRTTPQFSNQNRCLIIIFEADYLCLQMFTPFQTANTITFEPHFLDDFRPIFRFTKLVPVSKDSQGERKRLDHWVVFQASLLIWAEIQVF